MPTKEINRTKRLEKDLQEGEIRACQVILAVRGLDFLDLHRLMRSSTIKTRGRADNVSRLTLAQRTTTVVFKPFRVLWNPQKLETPPPLRIRPLQVFDGNPTHQRKRKLDIKKSMAGDFGIPT